MENAFADPEVFPAHCTLELPERLDGLQGRHDRAVIQLLKAFSPQARWWLGYLETGIGADVVFYDAPRVELYQGWKYVLVEAGPDQALNWRQSEGPRAEWKGALPDLLFPADRAWLLSTPWDDRWSCIGGCEKLVLSFLDDPELGARTRRLVPGERGSARPGHAS